MKLAAFTVAGYDRIITAAKVLVLLAGAFALVCTGLAVLQVRQTTALFPVVVHHEVELIRELADRQISAALYRVDRQMEQVRLDAGVHVGALRRDLIGEVQTTRKEGLQRIDDLRGDLGSQLTAVNQTIAVEAAKLNTSVALVAGAGPPVKVIAERMQEVVEIGTDCESSPNCWQNASHSLVRAWKESAEGTAKALPQITAAVVKVADEAPATAAAVREGVQQGAGVATDLHTFTAKAVAPTPWWKRLLWLGGELTARGLTR